MRIRDLTILLLPIIAPLFLLGWVLYVVGDRQAYNKLDNNKANDPVADQKPIANEEKVEMGLIDEIMEEKRIIR